MNEHLQSAALSDPSLDDNNVASKKKEGRAYPASRSRAAAGRAAGGGCATPSPRRAAHTAHASAHLCLRLDAACCDCACLVRAPWPALCRTSRRATPPTRSRWWLRSGMAARCAAAVALQRVAPGWTLLHPRRRRPRRRTAPRRWRLLWRRCGRAGARGAVWRAQPQPSDALRWQRHSAPRLQPPRAPRCRCVPPAPRRAVTAALRCSAAARARGA